MYPSNNTNNVLFHYLITVPPYISIFPIELWNDLHLQIIWYGREYSPARGWNIDKDIITKTIGRKSVLKETIPKKISR